MRPQRTEQDTVHRESRRKLDEATSMKKECVYTTKLLNNYMHGHLFRLQKVRIDRHLQTCVVCKSEFDALRRKEETRRLLKYIDSPEGVGHRVKEGVFALTKLKKVLYRPLWLTGIALVVAAVYYYAMLPRQLDLELESIVKTAPSTTAAVPPAALKTDATAVTRPAAGAQTPAPQPPPASAVEPLAVSITPNDEAAIRRINEVMRGHGQLRKMKFSDNERELSGKLTAKELLTFFNRIEPMAKVRYNRKRFESFPGVQPIPFVFTLKAAPKDVGKPAPVMKPMPDMETQAPAEHTVFTSRMTTSATATAR